MFLMDYGMEVIVGNVYKHTPSKSSISNGLVPAVWICHHIMRVKAIWLSSLQGSFLLCIRLSVWKFIFMPKCSDGTFTNHSGSNKDVMIIRVVSG